MPDSLKQLDLLLLTATQPRVVHRDGIYFGSYRYQDVTLAAFLHERVEIRYHPRDVAVIRVFHRGRYICSAVAPDLAGQTVALKDITAANRRKRQALRATLADRERIVRATLALRGGQDVSSAISEEEQSTPAEQTADATEDGVVYRVYATE
jgi:putative transposase